MEKRTPLADEARSKRTAVESKFATIPEGAAIIRVGQSRLRQAVIDGELRAYKHEGARMVVSIDELVAWRVSNPVKAEA